MIMRMASIDDCEGIAKVHLESWKTTYAGIIADSYLAGLTLEGRIRNRLLAFNHPQPDEMTFVAEEPDGRIVGFISGGKCREADLVYDAEVYAVYLLKEAQGLGYGRRFFTKMAAALKARGYSSLMLWVLRDNPALHFYEKMGGAVIGSKEIQIGEQLLIETALGWKVI
ncbi:GNAT family N-acetyltransferase [Paenibacillus montanisoli]|uniref:GNAT family N-acetyltransferase n=1 Tax=Paenibacillus montanisoli TaxID=2081970 RepID=A0A328U0D7_9BACL|nr:GNAT family N-acetyltransferase [Paenibacillus montanisoli]RAP76139.1 GNAT family N-acetyltransferase [Paenibacillus montanisoli]